jgi:hypothetical protein
MKHRQITIRVPEELYERVKYKCNDRLGIGISPLLRIFLQSFVTQQGVGFYIGDSGLCQVVNRWLGKKFHEKSGMRMPGPRLKDIYELGR